MQIFRKKWFIAWLVGALLVMSVAVASAQSLDLDVDPSPIFENINTYFPIFIAIVGIGAGIKGAMMLASWIGNMIVSALGGRGMR